MQQKVKGSDLATCKRAVHIHTRYTAFNGCVHGACWSVCSMSVFLIVMSYYKY